MPANRQGTGRAGRAGRTGRTEGTPQPEDLVGKTLRGGEYQIKSVLGYGGMAKVFLTSHITLDTPLALKQCRADQQLPESVVSELDQLLSSTPDIHRTASSAIDEVNETNKPTRRGAAIDFPSSGGQHTDHFLREALLLARLHHPSIPALYDYFFEDGNWYLVMDYVPGQTLSNYLRQQKALPPLEALNYTMQLCDVLEYLHQQVPPVVFRDLKPSNIMLTPDCRLVLVDFNIARYFKEGQLNDTTDLGSPGYAPPEQYQGGGQTDARSDLYSLGVILHEMLSGQRPTGRDMSIHLEALHSINPTLSLALSGLVSVATRLEPEYRFQSAYTFFCALERAYTLEEQRAYLEALKAPVQSGQPLSGRLAMPGQLQAGRPPGSPLPYTESRPSGDQGAYSRGDPGGRPGTDERQHTREVLVETHRERLENDQLEQELTEVDESLHLRAYMNFSSILPSLTQVQTSQTRTVRHRQSTFTTSVRRIVQICFVCALILFLVLVSLLTYTRVTHRGNSITRGQQVYATPRITTKPTPEQNGSWQELPSPPSPEADNTATYVQVQGKAYIYMNGGYRGPKDRPHYDRAFYRYDIANAHWEALADANAPGMVNNAAALDVQGNLFFTAGYSSDTYAVTSLLYEYQPGKGTFQQIVPPVQMPIGFADSMFYDGDGHLYITQGFMQAAQSAALAGTGWYRYDIASGQWQQLAPLPQGLGYVILAPDDEGNILLMGGATDAGAYHPTTRIYRYNVAHNTWASTPSTAPVTLSGATSCLANSERLIVIGGYAANHTTSLNTVWQVNLQTLSWTPLAPLPNGGSLLGTAACDGHGHVFLLRGANDPTQPTPDFWELTLPS